MREVQVTSRTTPAKSRSGKYPVGYSVIAGGGTCGTTIIQQNKDLLDSFEFEKEEGKITAVVPKIPFTHLQIGNVFLRWDEENNALYIVGPDGVSCNFYSLGEISAGGSSTEGGEGGGEGGGGIDENKLWEILAKEGTQQINKSHITTALTGYATEQWVLDKKYLTEATLTEQLSKYVTLTSLSEQLSKYVTLEVFNQFKETVDAHISNNNIHLTAEEKEKLSWFAKDKKGNIYVTNGLNFYTEGELSAGGFSDEGGSGTGVLFGIIVNGETYTPENGYITLPDYSTITELPWGAITGKPSWIGATKPSYSWNEISNKPSSFNPSSHTHTKSQITDFPTTWAWANISGKPTTLSGYGITDGVNAVSVTGSGNAVTSASVSGHTLTLTKGSTFLLSSAYTAADILAKLKTVDGSGSGLDADLLDGIGSSYFYRDKNATIGGSDDWNTFNSNGAWRAIGNFNGENAPSSTYKYGLLSVFKSQSTVAQIYFPDWPEYNIQYRICFDVEAGGFREWKSIAFTDSNVASATKLQTPRAIWGQSFDGTENVSGNMTEVGYIMFSNDGRIQCSSEGFIGFSNQAGTAALPIKAHSLVLADYYKTSSYRLHVDGTLYASRAVTLGSTLNVAGTTTINNVLNLYTSIGKSLSEINNTNGDDNAWNKSRNSSLRIENSNNLIAIMLGGTTNDRNANIQVGHNSYSTYANIPGNLYLNKLGGNVYLSSSNYTTYISGYGNVAGKLTANGGIYTTDISGNGSALYLGNSNNSSYVYLREDMRSNTDTWTISKSGAATFITLSVSSTSTLTGSVTMGSTLSVSGNITCSSNISARGEVSAGSSSDRRLKTILDKQDYIKRLMDIGMVVDYEYNDLAFTRNVRSIERRRYTGLIYQNVKNVLPQMAGKDKDGYGYLNYIHTDYINLITGALQQTILKQETIEQRMERLERENKDLKEQLNSLRL